MSEYDDGPRRYRSSRIRPRERGDPDFVQETTYVERGRGPPPRELVYRPRDDSIETIQREFPPPAGDRYRRERIYEDAPPRRTRSAVGRSRYRYDDDEYSDNGYPAGRYQERRRHRREYDRDYESDSPSPHRRRADRRKSGVGDMLEGLGLGGVAGALAGKARSDRDRSRSRSRDRGRDHHRDSSRHRRYSSGSRSRSRGKTERKWAQAAQAALVAGAVEAFRSRKQPGSWTGEKGRRIATAALGAGGIDGLVDRDPDKKSKRHLAEAVIGGLAANRLANGPRTRSQGPDSRARSRSRSIFGRSDTRGRDQSRGGGGGVKDLVAGGALAAAGKAIYDRVRSKSRRRRSRSASSNDSYEPPSRNRHPRGGRSDDTRSRASDTTPGRSRGPGTPATSSGTAGAAAAGAGAGALAKAGGKKKSDDDSSSSEDMEDVEKKRKHMRGKELLTAGLATIATIHAAHGVYSSMEAHEKRHKLVQEGEMTPEEARKKQTKAWVQDAAAVGIAALGIKGAFSEWKEMNEQRHQCHELEKRRREKAKRREKRQRRQREEREMRVLAMYRGEPYPSPDGSPALPPPQGPYPPPPGPPPGQRYERYSPPGQRY